MLRVDSHVFYLLRVGTLLIFYDFHSFTTVVMSYDFKHGIFFLFSSGGQLALGTQHAV